MDHRPTGKQSPFQSPSWTDETGAVVDQAMEREYNMHRAVILAPHSEGQVQSTFNYPLPNQVDMDELMEHLQEIYQQHAFRLNFSFGFILQHTETLEYRYFYAHRNNAVLTGQATDDQQCESPARLGKQNACTDGLHPGRMT